MQIRAQRDELAEKGARAEIDLGGRIVELRNWGKAHTRGDQAVVLPKERILFAGDLIEERMFPIFPCLPPKDEDVDAQRWVARHAETVGREGEDAAQIITRSKPRIIAAYPGSEHPALLDWEIGYFAARPT